MTWDAQGKFQEEKHSDVEAHASGTRPAGRERNPFTCPRCGVHTYGDKAYCTDCGLPLAINCPHCGMQSRYAYEYVFCPGCGAELKQPDEWQRPKKASRGPVMTAGKVTRTEEEII